jgi:hypothetical protein
MVGLAACSAGPSVIVAVPRPKSTLSVVDQFEMIDSFLIA